MNAPFLKKALPHLIAVAVFLIVAIVYCKPALEGKVLSQSDVMGWKGMAQQSVEYKEKYGHYPLWTESMFSGMPTYNILLGPTTQITIGISYLSKLPTLGLPKPINFFFLACICFYFLTLVLGINPWVGILSALAFAYSSFNPILVAAGHDSEILAIGYAPAVIASYLLILKRNYLLGASLLTLFFAFQMGTVHLQIVYYTLISIGILTLFFLIHSRLEKQWKSILTSLFLAVICGAIGYGVYADSMLPIQEYAKESMRGGRTELTQNINKLETKTGLSTDYAFMWSEGFGETFTIVAPNAYGGGTSGRVLGNDSKFVEKLTEAGMPEDAAIQQATGLAYWGDQPITSPIYFGAIVCFLFILGLVFAKSWYKWWLISIAFLGILLAWGKHFPAFNNFVFDYFPYYNHFRVPTMALALSQFAFPLLGALGLDQLLFSGESMEAVWKKFQTTILITSGLLVVLCGFYLMAEYRGLHDAQLKSAFVRQMGQVLARGKPPTTEIEQQANAFGSSLVRALQEDRQSLYGADLLRSVLLILAAVCLTGLYIRRKFKWPVVLGGLLVLSTFDLLLVGNRYLNEESFVEQSDSESGFTPTQADLQIMNDKEKNFRVYDKSTGGDPFQDSRASYFHNSIGGYHPAKLGLYEDIKTNQLEKGNMFVFDMLNAKYFIQEDPATHQPVARINPGAYGPCWLVKSIQYVRDGNAEMKALDTINTRDTVIIQQKFAGQVKFLPVADNTASIRLIENLNDRIDYKFSAKTNQFAVFSEVYYDKGWNVWLDGNKADYFRVDYILRGMPVPAGNHLIEFRFEPHSYILGNLISMLASIITYLLLISAAITLYLKPKHNKDPSLTSYKSKKN
jgi:Bacterial membrane protein YfhO